MEAPQKKQTIPVGLSHCGGRMGFHAAATVWQPYKGGGRWAWHFVCEAFLHCLLSFLAAKLPKSSYI